MACCGWRYFSGRMHICGLNKVTAIHDSLHRDFQFIYTFTGKCIIVKWGLAILKEEAFWKKHFVMYKFWSQNCSILNSYRKQTLDCHRHVLGSTLYPCLNLRRSSSCTYKSLLPSGFEFSEAEMLLTFFCKIA